MPRYLPEPAYHHGTPAQTAVLLINLGTPEAPTAPAVRRYLKEFLSDPRVVEIPRAIWWLILNGIILNIRPKKSAAKYSSVWTAEGSPLKVHTERQTKLLRGLLGQAGHHVVVDYAMRYGEPSIPDTLTRLKAAGCTRILLLPLYPQYAASTSATAHDAAFAWAQATRNQPEIRTVRSFADHPGYIAALAASVREHWLRQPRTTDSYRLIMSFHGVPRYTLDKGDPYHCECHKTARLVSQHLQLPDESWQLTFQSRFGREEWLKPYTDHTLQEWAKAGVKSVDVICPGFSADCLETLEEVAMENREFFVKAGGQSYHYIPALNDRPDHIQMIAGLVENHTRHWPETSPDWNAAEVALDAEKSQQRARAHGAPY